MIFEKIGMRFEVSDEMVLMNLGELINIRAHKEQHAEGTDPDEKTF